MIGIRVGHEFNRDSQRIIRNMMFPIIIKKNETEPKRFTVF